LKFYLAQKPSVINLFFMSKKISWFNKPVKENFVLGTNRTSIEKKRYLWNFLFLHLFFVASISPSYSQSILELESKLKAAAVEDKPAILNQLSEVTLSSFAPQKSIEYANLALKTARQTGDVNEEANALINLGAGYSAVREYKRSIDNYTDAVSLFEQEREFESVGVLWDKVSEQYLSLNNYQDALEASKKAMDAYKSAKVKKGVASSLLDIGDNYFKQKKFEPAVSYYKQSLKEYDELKDSKMKLTVLNRIGITFSNWGNYEDAYAYLNDALEMSKKNKMVSEESAISKNLEVIKKNMTNRNKSQTEYEKKLQQENLNVTQQMIREKDLQKKEIQSLETEVGKSIAEIEKLSIENQVKEYKIKAQNDEIREKKLQMSNKEKEIAILQKDKQIKESEIQKQKIITFSVVGGLLLMITFAVFVVRSLNQTRRQKLLIQSQKQLVENKNLKITDSLMYAQTIQESILPKQEILQRSLKDSFVLFAPKDIVSGDIYWTKDIGNAVLLSVIDCTGHGVPGAFMSLHAYNHLERIINETHTVSPQIILDELNQSIVKTMGTEEDFAFVKHGMEMTLIKLYKDTNELEYSGANGYGLIVRQGQIIELKGDNRPIGNLSGTNFSLKKERLLPGDMIYLFSDGYKDQNGGPNNKRFFIGPFKEMLREIAPLSCSQQKQVLVKKFTDWKKEREQIDDICIVAISI
jgi:serine phosphatase RsbU (regulator of sigma subunit)